MMGQGRKQGAALGVGDHGRAVLAAAGVVCRPPEAGKVKRQLSVALLLVLADFNTWCSGKW